MYCVTCMAFSDDKRSILCRKEGFNPMVSKWHRLYLKLPEHEHSALHRKHYWSWRTRQKAQVGHGVDFEMQRSLAKEAERLVALLERLLDVTLHLASRNMAFRGTSQRIGDLHNGNVLGTLEILSRYDSVLKEHLEKVKISQEKGKKNASSLSILGNTKQIYKYLWKTCPGCHTFRKERSNLFFYISHTEQNVIALTYVSRDPQTGIWHKTGEQIANMIISRLHEHAIDLKDCRGQGYDNGANMSGRIKGVRAKILEKFPRALFSLCCPFFKPHGVNRLYILVSNRPERWNTLLEVVGRSLHGLSDTAQSLPSILKALHQVISSGKLTNDAHSEAEALSDYFSSFRAVVLATFWVKILTSFEERNKILQSSSVSLEVGAANIKALSEEMKLLREKWPTLLSEASLVADCMGIPNDLLNAQQLRQRRSKHH
ncbi:unnamed protein product [Ranitomeya imitator]|uniref:DUF4371 domain-containing protein n=1 Tax=Ranitomeya imitator TaxID=111125 RepID=A0ABN9LVF4_9NEOB|nr:unnamed protein product [Ranitomeya imitator]